MRIGQVWPAWRASCECGSGVSALVPSAAQAHPCAVTGRCRRPRSCPRTIPGRRGRARCRPAQSTTRLRGRRESLPSRARPQNDAWHGRPGRRRRRRTRRATNMTPIGYSARIPPGTGTASPTSTPTSRSRATSPSRATGAASGSSTSPTRRTRPRSTTPRRAVTPPARATWSCTGTSSCARGIRRRRRRTA